MNNLMKYTRCSNNLRQFSIDSRYFQQVSTKPLLRKGSKAKKVPPLGWFMLIIPASTFSLGVWQMQRKKWKEDLLAELKYRVSSDPVNLPDNLRDLQELEYKPVRVKGEFLHDQEMYLGPRTLLLHGDASTTSSLVSSRTNTSQGYLVVTPFKLADRDQTILVNRGWVPSKNKDPRTRKEGQVSGTVDVIGIVRLNENRPVFTVKNQEGSNIWFYRDLPKMCAQTGASPIFLDATDEFDHPKGPVGGQTRVTLRNEHLSYILTWFSLCGATSYMWYKTFLKKG